MPTRIHVTTESLQPSAALWDGTYTTVSLNSAFWTDGVASVFKILDTNEYNLNAGDYSVYVKNVTGSNSFTYSNFTPGKTVTLYLSAKHPNFSRHYFPQTTYLNNVGDANTVFTFADYVTKVVVQELSGYYIGTTDLILTNIEQVIAVAPSGPSILLDGDLGYLKLEDGSYILL